MSSFRVSLKTVGCRLNQAETARIAAQFVAAGYAIVPFGAACDACVIHGCAVTRTAELDSVRLTRRAKRAGGDPVVVLAGCPAQYAGARLQPGAGADLLLGQCDKFRIPEILHELHPDRFPPAHSLREQPLPPGATATRALLKCQDGCDFRCAYCVVPDARGPATSRPLADIAAEARDLAYAGFREVVLTGANLGCYRDGSHGLVDLLSAVEALDGIARVRLGSIELTTAERDVIDHMAAAPKLCRFLHLPLQSGDDRILASMGRRYTNAQYRATAEYAVQTLPQVGLGADIIAGYPGEDETAFEHTVALVESLPFSNLHVFPYSPRPGTRAADLGDRVPAPLKKARVHRLLALAQEKRQRFAERFVGRDVAVLVERVKADGTGVGWTGEYLEAQVAGPGLQTNQLAPARIRSAEGGRLRGAVH